MTTLPRYLLLFLCCVSALLVCAPQRGAPRYGFAALTYRTVTGFLPIGSVVCWYDLQTGQFLNPDTFLTPPALDDSVVYMRFGHELGRAAIDTVCPYQYAGPDMCVWMAFRRDSITHDAVCPDGWEGLSKSLFERRHYAVPRSNGKYADMYDPQPRYDELRSAVRRRLPGLGIDTSRLGEIGLGRPELVVSGPGARSWLVSANASLRLPMAYPLRVPLQDSSHEYRMLLLVPTDTSRAPELVATDFAVGYASISDSLADRDSARNYYAACGLPFIVPHGIMTDSVDRLTDAAPLDVDGDECVELIVFLGLGSERLGTALLRRESGSWTVKTRRRPSNNPRLRK